MVICSQTNPLQGFAWSATTLIAGGLIIAAVLITVVLLILRKGRGKKAPEAIQLYDEKKHRSGSKLPVHKPAVRLFDEEADSSAPIQDSSEEKAGNPESVERTVQLFDEKSRGRKKKAQAVQATNIRLFDEENSPTTAASFQPTVSLSEADKAEQTKKASTGLPTTLQIFEEPDETYTIGNAQHIGKREEQQDSFGISDIFNREEVSSKGIFAVLADGMGGLNNGGESSRRVVSLMLDAFSQDNLDQNISDDLEAIVHRVNSSIYSEFNHDNEEGMTGSTVIAVLIRENLLYWISVGDSRIYLFRNNSLTQLNREHNYGAKLDENARMGFISTEEAMQDPNRAALTSYIGVAELNEIDRNTEPLQLQSGDRILMCSDGLFSALSDDEIAQVLCKKPQEAAQELVDQVIKMNRQYQDNVTVIVLGYTLI